MTKKRERRNWKVFQRSTESNTYRPQPPKARPDELWERIETLIASEPPTEANPESAAEPKTPAPSTQKRKRGAARRRQRRRRVVRTLDVLGSIVWIVSLIKLFVGDVDRLLISSFAPQLVWLLDMRWLLVLGLVALILILFRARTLGVAVAYIVGFPLVILFWKIPKLLIKRRSTLLVSSLAGVATGFLSRAKFFIVALAIACLSGTMILMGETPPVVLAGMGAMLLVVMWWLTVTAIDLLHTSAFIKAQERVINWIFGFELIERFVTPEQPDALALKAWSVDDAKKFRDTAGFALIARRALLFWASAVDQYRRGPAVVVLNALLVVLLLAQVIGAFAFLSYGVFVIDPTQFAFTVTPDAWTFVYYSTVGAYFGEISALVPVGGLAIAVKLLNGIIGSIGVLTIIGSTLMGFRATRSDSESNSAARALRRKADELESLSEQQFQMSLQDLQQHLVAAGWGLIGVVTWLKTKTPVTTPGAET